MFCNQIRSMASHRIGQLRIEKIDGKEYVWVSLIPFADVFDYIVTPGEEEATIPS